jgi:4-hydroxythreonine-4-phosphate dehydrogenase
MCFYIEGRSPVKWPKGSVVHRIGMTMGDPGGIGPEIALKAAMDPRVRAVILPIIIGDSDLLRDVAGDLGFRLEYIPSGRGRKAGQSVLAAERTGEGRPCLRFTIINTGGPGRKAPVGKPSKTAGLAAVRAVEAAVRLSASDTLRGIVTAPESKQSLALAGYGMIGHTELLARLTVTRRCAMMMSTGALRVVLATTHVPLAQVAARLDKADLVEKIRLANDYLVRHARVRRPRIGVCGLNPHAGEGGMLGSEDRRIIRPAVRRAGEMGIRVEGPFSADAVFRPDRIGRYNAVVAMYHDQGIIPVKMGDPGRVINVTLGLPIVRTSPGHGAAFDIAGKGVASAESMVSAVIECARMVRALDRERDAQLRKTAERHGATQR